MEDKKGIILKKAIERIAQFGVSDVEVKDLIDSGEDISIYKFYKRFGGKEGLYKQIFDAGFRLIGKHVFSEFFRSGITAEQKFISVPIGVLKAHRKDPSLVYACIVIGLNSVGTPLYKVIRETDGYREFFSMIGNYQHNLNAFLGDDIHVEIFMTGMMGMMSRLILWLGKDEPDNIERNRTLIIEVLHQIINGMMKYDLDKDKFDKKWDKVHID